MKYIAVIEQSIEWKEEANTIEEAVEMLRGLVEVDKQYTYAGTTSFKWTSHADTAKKFMTVKWYYLGKDGKAHIMSKRIYIKDYHPADEGIIPWKKRFAVQWEETRKMFL